MRDKIELITADYLKKLSNEGNKANVKVNEILNDLVKIAENGGTSHSIYLNEEYDGYYEYDIEAIKDIFNEKGFDVSIDMHFDQDDRVNIWKLSIKW